MWSRHFLTLKNNIKKANIYVRIFAILMPVLNLGLKCVESMFFMISGGRVADIEIASTYKSIKRIKTN